jgi:alkylation response protein AidB-like acyl-CoA dehydrogenase
MGSPVTGAQRPDPHAAARALGPEIRACADQIERERQLPASLVDAMAAAGLFKLATPEALGGGEAPLATILDVIEEVARADGSAGWTVMVANQCGVMAGFVPPRGAGEIFADPRAYIAGVVYTAGKAQAVDGGYRVTGRWRYASGCRHATWMFGTCAVYDGDSPRVYPDGTPENRFVWLPVAECEIIDTWHVTGMRGTGSHDFAVTDVFVPEERTCPDSITGFPVFRGTRYHHGPLYEFGLSVVIAAFAPLSLGIARGAIDAFVEMIGGGDARKAYLRDDPAIQAEIGKAEAQLRAARAFAYETVNRAWASAVQTGHVSDEQRVLMRLAARHAAITAAQVVEALWYAGGALSIFASNPLERRFRDVHVAAQRVPPAVYGVVGRLSLGHNGGL